MGGHAAGRLSRQALRPAHRLLVGAGFGALAGLTLALAAYLGSFALLCVGAGFGGLYAAAHQSYRFAAADTASDAFKPRAISWVLAGGMFAGLFGSQLVIATKDIWPQYLFAASYLAQAAVAIVAAGVLWLLRAPPPVATYVPVGEGRPLTVLFRQPRLIVAVLCGVASYSMMNLIMTSAPIAMIDCNHSITDATLGLQWHVMAMYAPSFFTGALMTRFGIDRVVWAGLAIMAVAMVVAMTGITVCALLECAGAAGDRLELRLHRRHRHGHPVPPPQRAQQGPGGQRLPGVRLDGDRIVFVGPDPRQLRLDRGERGRAADHRDGGRRCWRG